MSIEHAQFRFIPARCLALSSLNVRKSASGQGIEQLAELIAAEGVLQNLNVYEQASEGAETTHAVIAGGRRWRALNALIAKKRIEGEYPVPCMIVSYERAVQISLSENSGREPMHPADEFEAFRRLIDAGQSVEDVAARFGLTPLIVQRRLKLANVAPAFIGLYRDGDLTLEHLMALAVTDDHERQTLVWQGLAAYERTPHGIRKALTEHEVPARAALARFVGVKAYEKAGGVVRRDLFEEDEGVMLDRDLVRQLATEKLGKHAKRLKSEGLAWVEVRLEFDYASRARYGRVRRTPRARNAQEQRRLDALRASRDHLQEQLDGSDGEGEAYDNMLAQLEDLDSQIDALEEQHMVPDAEQQSLAGAVVFVGPDGKAGIERDLLRAEDADRFERTQTETKGTASREAPRLHSSALVGRLTAQRTLALRAELVQQPMTAVVALTHRLALQVFYPYSASSESAVRISFGETGLAPHVEELQGTAAERALAARHMHFEGILPDEAELLTWLMEQSHESMLGLLAYCVSTCVDGVQRTEGPSGFDALAQVVRLDMTRWWRATAKSYFGSVPKSQILAVIGEAVSPTAAATLERLKKEALAEEAERLLADKDWLPSLMRMPG